MLGPLRAIHHDRALRLTAMAIIVVGGLGASIAPYQSLLAIKVFGLSDSAYSLILATASVVSVAAALGVGILTDQRANRRLVAIVSAALMLAGIVLVWLGNSVAAFVLAHAVILPLSSTLFGQIFALARLAAATRPAPERDAIMAAMRALFALPFVMVLPLWSWVFRAGADLLIIYPVIAAASLLLLGLIVRHWPADGRTDWADPKSGVSAIASLREILVPSIAVRIVILGAATGGVVFYMILLGLIFDAILERGAGDTALFAGFVAGLEVPVMLSLALITPHVSRTHLIAAGALIYAGFLAAFPFLAPTPYVWALLIPAAIGAGIVLSLPIAYLQDLIAARPGMGGALLAVQRVVGDILYAGAFALGTALGGYTLAAILGAGLMVAGAMALLIVDRDCDRTASRQA